MGKDKIKRFTENLTFASLVQPEFDEIFKKDYKLKGNWAKDFFGNEKPIVVEMGCGRGEYSVELGKYSPDKNFIGIDIKGARLWRGAKTVTEEAISNVAFLRTRIEFIESFFANGEISELWITFPDPQLRKTRVKKRLTAPEFLKMYAKFLRTDGCIHLKTDSQHLHEYTKVVASENGLKVMECCNDIYPNADKFVPELCSIQTTYEKRYLKEGLAITYIKFSLGERVEFVKPEFAPDEILKN